MTAPVPAAQEPRTMDRSRWSRSGAFAIVLLPYLLLVLRFNFVCDDAFISFRYARNFAEGLGLRYNPGVEPPVEGYTNFLWVLWCSVFEWLGIDVTLGARATSVICGLVTLWWVMRLLEQRFDLSPMRAALPTLFLATFPPFAVWSTGGLATVPFTLALFAMFVCLLGGSTGTRFGPSATWGVLAAGLRADGALFVGFVLALAALRALREGRPADLRATLRIGVAVALAVMGHLVFRLSYYEDWLPNTAYAKVSFSRLALEQGGSYLLAMSLTFPALILIPVLTLLALACRRQWRATSLELLALPVAISTYVVLVAGGDFMCMARLLVPALPFLAVLAALPLRQLQRREGRPVYRAAMVAWPVLLILISLPPAFNQHVLPGSVRFQLRFRAPLDNSEYEFWYEQKTRTQKWARLGQAIARHADSGDSLVSGAIGAVGYYSRLFIYDRFGLVHRDIARREVPESQLREQWAPPGHHKGVPITFFLSERPTYLRAGIGADRRKRSDVPGYRIVYHALPRRRSLPDERFLYLLQRVEP